MNERAASTASTAGTARAPRKDSVRNRARLIGAARQVFAERGLDATLDEIAARAGLGVGTAYRHFADKYELAAELLGEATQEVADEARAALAIDDPWDALVWYFQTSVARQAANRGLYEALAGRGRVADKIRVWPELAAAVTELFDRARRAGAIRDELRAEDSVAVFTMLGALDTTPERRQRYLGLILDGMRATGRPTLPGSAAHYDSLDDVISDTKRTRRPR